MPVQTSVGWYTGILVLGGITATMVRYAISCGIKKIDCPLKYYIYLDLQCSHYITRVRCIR